MNYPVNPVADMIPTTQIPFENPMSYARLAVYVSLAYATRKNKSTYIFMTAAGLSLVTTLMSEFAKNTVNLLFTTNKGV
jgi:hypothetical protein